jgi:glycosyltransferase involved in cell wall biosynthesis
VEIIVVDGGSSDNTLEIVQNYNVKLIHVPANGEPDAINKGIRASTGDIVAYLDSDDCYTDNCFNEVIDAFLLHKEAQWVYGKGKIIDAEGKETRSLITTAKEMIQKRYSYNRLLVVDFIVQPTVFMKRELFNRVGDFNVKEKLVFDYEYWLRAGRVSTPYYINKYLASWRAHGENPSMVEYKKEAYDAYAIGNKFNKKGLFITLTHYLVYLGTLFIYSTIKKKK